MVFISEASNLVDDDHNGVRDIFVEDLGTHVIIRASTADGDGEADAFSFSRTFSPDGKKVAFNSWASYLVPGSNGQPNACLKNLREAVSRVNGTNPAVQPLFSWGTWRMSPIPVSPLETPIS